MPLLEVDSWRIGSAKRQDGLGAGDAPAGIARVEGGPERAWLMRGASGPPWSLA